jgi:hypothetical protein
MTHVTHVHEKEELARVYDARVIPVITSLPLQFLWAPPAHDSYPRLRRLRKEHHMRPRVQCNTLLGSTLYSNLAAQLGHCCGRLPADSCLAGHIVRCQCGHACHLSNTPQLFNTCILLPNHVVKSVTNIIVKFIMQSCNQNVFNCSQNGQ